MNCEDFDMASSGIQDLDDEIKKAPIPGSSTKFCLLSDHFNKALVDPCVVSDEPTELKSVLKTRQNMCCREIQVETMRDDKSGVIASAHAEIIGKITNTDGAKIDQVIEHPSQMGEKVRVCGSRESHEKGNDSSNAMQSNGGDVRCVLNIELVDDTALIQAGPATQVGNGSGEGRGFSGLELCPDGDGSEWEDANQELDRKKKRCRKLRGKGRKKDSTADKKEKATHVPETEKVLGTMTEAFTGCERKGGNIVAYLREEMEKLRFLNEEEQKKKWIEVYCGLGSDVAGEYDGLVRGNHHSHVSFDFDPRQQFVKRKATAGISGGESSKNAYNELEDSKPLDPAIGGDVTDVDDHAVINEECSEDEDSDEYYRSIQRPAFLVTGEPDFDSGPPQDGLEYLRRVRWEAERMPKVKVAKLDKTKLNKEQTIYMLKIPDIEKCPEYLLPLKQWEDAFLADFLELRMALSQNEISYEIPCISQTVYSIHEEVSHQLSVHEEVSHQLSESIILEKFDHVTTEGVDFYESQDWSAVEGSKPPTSLIADVNAASSLLENLSTKSSVNGPTLSKILSMDSVARVSMLKKCISKLETMSNLSRDDCVWLFALCAAVDAPLDADTSAALRCLLRKCSSLRAGKSNLDDEVIMLNILITISGRYFGQSEGA